jgi:hypothetical protein
MMNFPQAPTIGQPFPAAPAPPNYIWDGEKWGPPGYAHVHVERAGDTMSGPLVLPAAPAPVAANAVRKDYVDTAIAAIPTPDLSSKVSKSGDTMSGRLTINSGGLTISAGGYNVNGNSRIQPAANGDALIVTDTTGTRYFVFTPESAGNTATFGYYAGAAGWGSMSLQGTWNFGNVNFTGAVNSSNKITAPNSGYLGAAGASSALEIGSGDGGDWASIAYHIHGKFGCNVGMNANGHFYMGGWSHGTSTWHKFWTTRDFNYTPQPNLGFTPVRQSGGAYQATNTIYIGWDGGGCRVQVDGSDLGRISFANAVVDGRMPHAGDPGVPYNGMWEPYGGAVCTGCGGGAPVGYYVIQSFRMRYMQLCNTGWWTIGYA